MKFKKIIIPLLLSCCLMSGCWDKIEIDRKSFISTIALDVGKDINKEKEFKSIKPNDEIEKGQFEKISVTYGFPDISELGPEKGGAAQENFITTESYSMESSVQEMAVRTSRNIHFGHTQLLILSDELLQHPDTFKEILDFLQRKPSINKGMQVIIAEGSAAEYVKYKPVMEKNIENYITGLMQNSDRNSTILPMTLNELLILLSQNGNAIVPSLYYDKEKDEINLSGVGMIKNYKIVGYLNKNETTELEMLRGKLKGGVYSLVLNGSPIDFQVDNMERKIKLVDKDPKNLKFKIEIKLEGSIQGYTLDEELFNEGKLTEIQDHFNYAIENRCEKISRITQDKFGIDPIGFREYIEKFHPDLYKEIEKNWEEAYKNSNLDVEVYTQIRRIGLMK